MASNIELYNFPMGKMNTKTAAEIAANPPDVVEQLVHETDNDILYWADAISVPGDWNRFDTAFIKALAEVTANYMTLNDSASQPPMNITERSSAPSSPVAGDIYLDDGTNTASSGPGFRRYTGTAWEDVSAAGGSGGGSGGTMATLFVLEGFSNSLTTSTPATLAYSNNRYDPSGVVDGDSANKHHLPQTGKYKVEVSLQIVPASFASYIKFFLNIEINNTDPGNVWEVSFDAAEVGSNFTFGCVFYVSATANDFIEFVGTCEGENVTFDSASTIIVTRIDDGDLTYSPPGV